MSNHITFRIEPECLSILNRIASGEEATYVDITYHYNAYYIGGKRATKDEGYALRWLDGKEFLWSITTEQSDSEYRQQYILTRRGGEILGMPEAVLPLIPVTGQEKFIDALIGFMRKRNILIEHIHPTAALLFNHDETAYDVLIEQCMREFSNGAFARMVHEAPDFTLDSRVKWRFQTCVICGISRQLDGSCTYELRNIWTGEKFSDIASGIQNDND